VHFEKQGDGFAITRIERTTRARVPGIDEAAFREAANTAKETCPVSVALGETEISLDATLET
jgi:osmotically inducible protein OsmC